ncbi:MAG: NADH-quinone oxidoreductase subunit N [bacterium]
MAALAALNAAYYCWLLAAIVDTVDSTRVGEMAEFMRLFLTPEVLLLACALVLLLGSSFCSSLKLFKWADIALIGIGLVFLSTFIIPSYTPPSWAFLYVADGVAFFFKRFFLIAAGVTCFIAREHPVGRRGEFFVLILMATIGMSLTASAADFIMLFVALELVTVSFYILVSSQRNSAAALEAGVKYLVMGALSTAFLAYGIALLYGTFKTTFFSVIAMHLELLPKDESVLFPLLFIVAGLAFKIAAVPFHSWAADTYQGAPTPVSAFLSIGSKAAGFAAFLRVFYFNAFGVEELRQVLGILLAALAIGSVVLGSFAALPQRSLKRLLGYSSIANTGFLLMALSCFTDRGAHAVFFYLCAYLLAVALAFCLIAALEKVLGGDDLRNYAGLAQRSPSLAFAMLIAMSSLAGIPPLIGFFAKLDIFISVLETGRYGLLFTGVACAVMGLYYYLNIARWMYGTETVDAKPISLSLPSTFLILLLTSGIIILGIWPTPILLVISLVLAPFH